MKHLFCFLIIISSILSCKERKISNNNINELNNEESVIKISENDLVEEITFIKIKNEYTLELNELNIIDKNNDFNIKIGDKLNKIIGYYDIIDIKDRKYSNIIYKEIICDKISFFIPNYPPMENNQIDFEKIILHIEIIGENIFTNRGISIGDEKSFVIEIYGEPNYIQNKLYGIEMPKIKEIYYYYNGENDVREINICFNENNEVVFITLGAGD
jgi:hypothetical protein